MKRQPRAFTIIELLVTLAVIGVLVGLYVTVVRETVSDARRASDLSRAVALRQGVDLFQSELSFLPPLVVDGEPLSTAIDPIDPATGLISVRDPGYLRARTAPNEPYDANIVSLTTSASDKRYSKLSLTYFLAGRATLDDGTPVDGAAGDRLKAPRRIGTTTVAFESTGRTYSPFVTPRSEDELITGYQDPREYAEHGLAAPTSPADASISALVDGGGKAFRYYRWENFDPAANNAPLGESANIPLVLRDPNSWRLPNDWPTNDFRNDSELTELRNANYAIVGAGPNGVFGTETLEVIRAAIENPDGLTDTELRRAAWEDNVVVTGGG